MLWSAAVTKGYACPLWLTFKQAIELGGHVRKGEAGEFVVYANSITRTETDAKGEETEHEIPYMKVTRCSTPSSVMGCPRITPPRQSPLAAQTAGSPHGPWRLSNSPALTLAFPNASLAALGLLSLVPTKPINLPNRRVRTRMHGGVGGGAVRLPLSLFPAVIRIFG
jgi:hypothetical protein